MSKIPPYTIVLMRKQSTIVIRQWAGDQDGSLGKCMLLIEIVEFLQYSQIGDGVEEDH